MPWLQCLRRLNAEPDSGRQNELAGVRKDKTRIGRLDQESLEQGRATGTQGGDRPGQAKSLSPGFSSRIKYGTSIKGE